MIHYDINQLRNLEIFNTFENYLLAALLIFNFFLNQRDLQKKLRFHFKDILLIFLHKNLRMLDLTKGY
jgi:hypothetical protein